MNFDKTLNHSAAHVLAASLQQLYPDIQFAIGPAIDEGFYYDFYTPETISIHDLVKIEKQMKKIISGAYDFEQIFKSKKEALAYYNNNKFKSEIINSLDDNELSFYTCNKFTDLCKGPHVKNTKDIKAFKLLSIAGSYWRGDAKNTQLTRIYGIAFHTQNELDEYLKLVEERKERDHRKIGKDMELFTFNKLAGQGLPIWLPNGTIIKTQLQKFINYLQFKYDFSPVMTPVLGSVDLYKTSGHWDHYKENIFPPMDVDGENLVLRPMTCPHHILVYKNNLHSYKQLPIRLCEHSILHRYEASGGLTGLERVRDMILEDTHIFCKPDQIKYEVKRCYEMILEAHNVLGTKIHQVDLSLADFNDKDKYHGNHEMWKMAEQQLEDALKELNIKYNRIEGEAAFYGPKIDFQVKTVLNRIITMSTIQLDFLLPERFNLEYKNENGEFDRPVMIHLGLIGTYERFLSILLEQTKGILPFWMCAKQIEIIPVNEQYHLEFCNKLAQKLKNIGIRASVDNRNERLSKKIRDAQINKIPIQIIVGDEEINNKNLVSYREYGKENTNQINIDDFLNFVKQKNTW